MPLEATVPDTHAASPLRRFQVRADHVLAWLATAIDSTGHPFAETYGIDDTFRPDGADLHDRIQILVSQAHTDGILTVPGHHLELWQVADEGFLLTLDPPHGPRLCSKHLSISDLLPDKTAGSVAAFAVLDTTARVANQLLDEHDHIVSRTRRPGIGAPATTTHPLAAGAILQPGTAAATNPPPLALSGPATSARRS
jgi:hypothetical protein